MKDFICKKCGNTTYIIQEKSNGTGVATGLYCAKCGTWHKWLNKQEKILYTTHSEEIDKDKEIARLTAENERSSKQLTDGKCVYLSDSETAEGCVQGPCPNYKTVEDILKENAELRARLDRAVVLPCKVGDTVYCIFGTFTIHEWTVQEIRLLANGKYFLTCGHEGTDDYCGMSSEHFGIIWSTDRAEVEARLAELKGGEGE